MKRECKHSRWSHILAALNSKVIGWNCWSCNHSELYSEAKEYDYNCNCASCHNELVYEDNKIKDKEDKMKNAKGRVTCMCCGSERVVHSLRD